MPTPASQMALKGLRDLSTLQWYVIPLLALVFYVYTNEMKKAKATGNWDAIFAGLTVFGMDFINETWNGWVFHLTQHSALWTTPGETALRTMVGWNIEIMFMFAISGIIYYNTLSEDKEARSFWDPRPLVLGHRLRGVLRLCGVPAEHGRAAGVGISLVESLFPGRVAHILLRLFPFLCRHHRRAQPQIHESQDHQRQQPLHHRHLGQHHRFGNSGVGVLRSYNVWRTLRMMNIEQGISNHEVRA